MLVIDLGKPFVGIAHLMHGGIAQSGQMFHYLVSYGFLFHGMQISRNYLQRYIIFVT